MNALTVGVDIAKEFHWVVATVPHPDTGKARQALSRKVDNTPGDIAALLAEIAELEADYGRAVIGLDILGGIARLLEVMVIQAGIELRHVSGLAVKTARRATRGGEHKSDPRDARVIADLVRTRDDLRVVDASDSDNIELSLLVSRRHDLVEDQTRTINRMLDLLCSIHPGLERVINARNKVDLALLARYVTPAEIRRAGRARILAYLKKTGRHNGPVLERLVAGALQAATDQQHVRVPGEDTAAAIIKDLAIELLALRTRLSDTDQRIAELLTDHPDAALIRSLPGMGAVLTAEFLAVAGRLTRFASGDQLASAAGVAPALQQSGKVRYLQRSTGGDRVLKRVFYQAAFCALQRDPTSRAYYDRKRAEGKTHHQAVIALARRRVNVLHAILRTRTPYEARQRLTAA
ncbi:IS110 family transposase [Kribbella capetownensis]|uniref:IS110 family transposase n=1 Tax=Kribbella capetownensis TaxID=1572659 RepID=A0A4R0IJ46_9ACTN|nr:IS110 family transposase [Kribbella capetownensis]TCC31118.1 IS110 family transposase [Kribbella capetownensis]